MKQRAALLFVLAALIASLTSSAVASSFTGVVIDATVYSFVVKNRNEVKIFQIRAETKGGRNIHPQDFVAVTYRDESGILIAENVVILKQ